MQQQPKDSHSLFLFLQTITLPPQKLVNVTDLKKEQQKDCGLPVVTFFNNIDKLAELLQKRIKRFKKKNPSEVLVGTVAQAVFRICFSIVTHQWVFGVADCSIHFSFSVQFIDTLLLKKTFIHGSG